MDTKYEFVSGKSLYEKCEIKQNVTIRYYQICQYDKNNMYNVRSLLFEGNNQKNCMYEFVIKENKTYDLSKKELNKFIKYTKQNTGDKLNKIFVKIYPYNDVVNIPYPNGNDLMMIMSILVN